MDAIRTECKILSKKIIQVYNYCRIFKKTGWATQLTNNCFFTSIRCYRFLIFLKFGFSRGKTEDFRFTCDKSQTQVNAVTNWPLYAI